MARAAGPGSSVALGRFFILCGLGVLICTVGLLAVLLWAECAVLSTACDTQAFFLVIAGK